MIASLADLPANASAAAQVSDRWRSDILKANGDYDARTDHGRSEGVVFP